MMTRIEVLLFLVTCLTKNSQCCPMNCLCYLDREPKSVLCANQGLEEFPERISDLVEHLDLSGNELKMIPGDIGRLVELKFINLSNNKLTGLPEQIGELWKLEKLDLSDNQISNVVEGIGVIARLPNLRLLYLRNNPVTGLEDLGNVALRALDASQCMISQLGNESLAGFPELISLSLDGNPLKSMRYIRGEKLKWMDLSNCMLNFLHPDTFVGVPELEQLRMANNPTLVYSSRKETLIHGKLKRLDVSGCNLDRPGLHGLPALTHAILSRNVIRLLPDRIFARNKMIIHLYLSGNGLAQLNGSSFAGMPKLEILDLSSNNLDYLPIKLLEDKTNLQLLNLSYNDLKEVPSRLLISPVILDLSSNLIEHIPRDSLTHMPRIKILNLSNNRLEAFDSGVDSSTLRTLILERNRLVTLSNDSFANLPSLTGIDLSGNRLTEGIGIEVFQNNVDLHTILLHDNPWRCDCEQLYPTFIYLTDSSKTSASSLICQSPSNVSGYSWATACRSTWSPSPEAGTKTERTYGLVLMGLLIAILVFGSIVSIGHTVKAKRRQAMLRLQEAERAEARERLILHRRTQMEELRRQENIPRVHPEELIGPPTYEEAVEMPRLARSLDNLDSISMEGLGQSAQSLDREAWSRKRRKQSRKRIGKRARSEDDLDTGREERTRSSEQIIKTSQRTASVSRRIIAPKASATIYSCSRNVERRRRESESEEPTSSVDVARTRTARPRTPSMTKNRRLWRRQDGHSSDDEDSDVLRNSTVAARRGVNVNDIQVIELPREPRSGTYRPPVTPIESSPSLVSSPEPGGTSEHISRSRIV